MDKKKLRSQRKLLIIFVWKLKFFKIFLFNPHPVLDRID